MFQNSKLFESLIAPSDHDQLLNKMFSMVGPQISTVTTNSTGALTTDVQPFYEFNLCLFTPS